MIFAIELRDFVEPVYGVWAAVGGVGDVVGGGRGDPGRSGPDAIRHGAPPQVALAPVGAGLCHQPCRD